MLNAEETLLYLLMSMVKDILATFLGRFLAPGACYKLINRVPSF